MPAKRRVSQAPKGPRTDEQFPHRVSLGVTAEQLEAIQFCAKRRGLGVRRTGAPVLRVLSVEACVAEFRREGAAARRLAS